MKIPLLLTIALAHSDLCAQSQQCNRQNMTLNDAYVVSFTGTAGGPIFNNSTGPFAAVGRIVFDGNGNLQLTATTSIIGFIIPGSLFTGTYTVNRDCTGTMRFATGSSHGVPTFDIVSTPGGRHISIIQTNTGTVITGKAIRLDHNDH
jgi:hypothetical protein